MLRVAGESAVTSPHSQTQQPTSAPLYLPHDLTSGWAQRNNAAGWAQAQGRRSTPPVRRSSRRCAAFSSWCFWGRAFDVIWSVRFLVVALMLGAASFMGCDSLYAPLL